MLELSDSSRAITFTTRPTPVSGDMRIAWRLSLCLLILMNSRGKKASFAKMHLLNDALRSQESRDKLLQIISGEIPKHSWRTRVEPAFSRAIDFLVGEGFARWVISSERTSLKITPHGEDAAQKVAEETEAMLIERQFLEDVKAKVGEGFVRSVITAGTKIV